MTSNNVIIFPLVGAKQASLQTKEDIDTAITEHRKRLVDEVFEDALLPVWNTLESSGLFMDKQVVSDWVTLTELLRTSLYEHNGVACNHQPFLNAVRSTTVDDPKMMEKIVFGIKMFKGDFSVDEDGNIYVYDEDDKQ